MRFSSQPQPHTVRSGSWRMSIRGRCAGSGARRGTCFAESRGGVGASDRKLEPDGLEVGVDRLLEQVALLAVQLFAARGELPAPHHRHLVRQLLDLELPALQLLILAADLLDQLGGEVAQLLRVHRGELIVHLHACDGAIAAAKLATKR